MEKVVVFIDAGYLYSGGTQSLYKRKLPRSAINIDIDKFVKYIKNSVVRDGEKLLRIYWYDGVLATGMTPEQQSLTFSDGIKFRKGIVNEFNEQKGIDTQIIKDIFELSFHKAFSRGIILSADGDLVVAAEIAQKFGIEIDLIHIPDTNLSLELKQEVDHVITLPENILKDIIICKEDTLVSSEHITIQNVDILEKIIYEYINILESSEKETLLAHMKLSNGNIPHEADKNLLSFSKNHLCRLLDNEEKRTLRDIFYKNILANAEVCQ